MKKCNVIIRLVFCLLLVAGTVVAGSLNEWTFQKDAAGLTLSQATNSGIKHAVFASGGAGFLETTGSGSLFGTGAGVSNGMWSSGAILDADVTDVSSGVQYLRYDFDYDLTANHDIGTVTGLSVVDSSGGHVAGVAVVGDWAETGVPAEYTATPVAEGLHLNGRISVIVKVDVSAQTMAVWYDLTGGNNFDENSPATNNVPIQLTSIDKLRFQATGDFHPAGSADYVAVDNIRTASTWEDIAFPVYIPLSVNSLFQNHMVLQRDMNTPVWGHVTPGEVVTVKVDGVSVGTATADAEGKWLARITLRAHDGGLSHVVLISSRDEPDIQFNDVVFGDVYIAAGQSNMAKTMNGGVTGYESELLTANSFQLIRQVGINPTSSDTPWEEPFFSSSWTSCSNTTLAKFTAVGYFFAKNIYEQTGVPVGLMFSAWGGQLIERFTNPEGMAAVPELSGMLQYSEEGGITNLYDIYNAMIAPLVPYGVKGAVWYQGEANAADAGLYRYRMQALIRGWRQTWAQGDFFFYYIQLPNYNNTYWPEFREAQTRFLSETNTGMAITIDIGTDLDIHPPNKTDVGCRLAQWALAEDYRYDRVSSGPLYRNTIIEGSQVRIIFDHAESGLMTGWKYSTNAVVESGAPLQNFEIAGSNKTFVSATAVIDQDTVLVSSPQVSNPVYVRYCYTGAPAGTNKLYNAAHIPASPFRTDKSYHLDVKSGSGTAVGLVAGAQVSVSAAAAPVGKVFDRWIGAASELNNLNASTATVTIPEHALYLLATYRDTADTVYTLTVTGGFGSGTSQAGSILNIEASPGAGQIFDHWAGDTQEVTDVSADSTTLRMPTNNVTITAVYRTSDSAGDGITDTWRAAYFGGSGATTNNDSCATADPDEDGMSNLQEYNAGTSPVDAQSALRLKGGFSAGNAALSFQSVAGRRYRVERTGSLTAPAWEALLYNVTGNGLQKQALFNTEGAANAFYRLRLVAE